MTMLLLRLFSCGSFLASRPLLERLGFVENIVVGFVEDAEIIVEVGVVRIGGDSIALLSYSTS
ncbi:hypothetical protein Tco_0552564, partial [Tanacetum coccineum]